MEFDEIIKDAIERHSEDTEWKINTRVRFDQAEMYRNSMTLRLKVDLDIQHFKPEEEEQ